MLKVSVKFKDRPLKPVDTAIWWTEYVLRHDDHSDLKPLGMSQSWFVRRCLDVWAFVLGVTLLITMLGVYMTLKIWSCCRKISTLRKLKID